MHSPSFLSARRTVLRVFFGLACLAVCAVQAQTTVVIMRHGEKPEAGLGQLTCKGLNRALALAPVLLERYGMPSALYAPNPAELKKDKGIPYAYIRPLATIEPTAVRAGLPVQIAQGMADIEPLVEQLRTNPPGVYFVAWEHHWAANLARRLVGVSGGDPAEVPAWPDDDFDSLYVVRLQPGAQGAPRVTFRHEQQNLNGMPDACPGKP